MRELKQERSNLPVVTELKEEAFPMGATAVNVTERPKSMPDLRRLPLRRETQAKTH